MPTASFTLDTSQFGEAVRFVLENTRRTLPEIINRAALVTIIGGQGVKGAMQRTARASREAILAVPIKAVAASVMNKHRGQKLTRVQVRELVRKEYRRRIAAIGYTAVVGWNKAAMELGGRGVKGHTGKGYAEFGYAKPATAGNFEAIIVNTAPAAVLIGEQPLQAALNDTARDMIEYWSQRVGVIFHANS